MKRQCTSLALGVIVSCLSCLRLSTMAPASGPASSPAALSLDAVLQQEADGQLVDRRQLLLESEAPTSEAIGWHTGHVNLADSWCRAEDLHDRGTENSYLAMRRELEADPQKHFKLARWCTRHDFPVQARAHYYAALADSPNLAEARRALGHVQLGDQWIDQTDLKAAQQSARLMLQQLDEWVPKLNVIARTLQMGSASKKADALEELDKLDAVTALPALELFAVNLDDDIAMPLIRKIAGIRSREACRALVNIALAQPSSEARRKAADKIRNYPEHFYVPELLNMLSKEITVENRIVMQPDGHISLTTLVSNELQNRKQQQRFEKHVQVISALSINHRASHQETTSADVTIWSVVLNIPKSNPLHVGRRTVMEFNSAGSASLATVYVPPDVATSAAQNLRQQGKRQEQHANQQNRLANEKMNPVFRLLRETTRESIGNEPESWWTWWSERSERYQMTKPTSYAYNQQREQIAITTQSYTSSSTRSYKDIGKVFTQQSCLVPGTLVQTQNGLVPIEKIQIGDLVLSQNPETAELALKPVVLTTLRPPKTTLKIMTDDHTIEATGGHSWWVSGRGWTKSRELQPGMLLHTAAGNVEVREVEESLDMQPTHNLVVDQFHTYFVGPGRVLSYDNSPVKPCLHSVPGFGLLATNN